MLIEVHAIQNHSPANLNRDDLGAPKTCWFGGVLRSRISSQCLKRSIRMSDEFHSLLGGLRTRRLPKVIAERAGDSGLENRAREVLETCGFLGKGKGGESDDSSDSTSKMLVYTTYEVVDEMVQLLKHGKLKKDELARQFAELIANKVAVPDMALSGRMLEPDKAASTVWEGLGTTVDASLQVAHAISTHEARPEVDYYVAADDVAGADAGAGYVDEAMFASACFYKYFSINWETLLGNLDKYPGDKGKLAAHTVGAFIRAAALTNPAGKQNSFAAHNLPDGMLVEIRSTPISYANAFAKPVASDERDIIAQTIAQLAQYVHDLDAGYGGPDQRFWFSPNLRYGLETVEDQREVPVPATSLKSIDDLLLEVVKAVGHDWEEVKKVAINSGVTP